jgi:tetratricopeptide (TPR) repeat protein
MLCLLDLDESPEGVVEKLKEPKTSDDYYLLGLALEKLGKYPDVEVMFRRALQKDMRHMPSMYGLGFLAFQNAKEAEAKKWVSRAIRFDPEAESHIVRFQKELRTSLPLYQSACAARMFCLQELERQQKLAAESCFELGKLLFETSQFQAAIPYLKTTLKENRYAQEASEYLSFAFENLFKGEELLERTLDLIGQVPNRADLFFNLAMVCQHDQKRMDLALHFFYLASQEDPHDPGLRFSLEQAALEVISESKRRKMPSAVLMFAHLYQGSTGVAKKYAYDLQDFGLDILASQIPEKLWSDWVLPDAGPLGKFIRSQFKISPKTHSL